MKKLIVIINNFYILNKVYTMNNPHLIFRMTHINNLNLFLDEGHICAPNYKKQLQFSISYQEINNKRNNQLLTTCGQSIHDFLAFYFSPLTAMSYALHQSKVDIHDHDGNRVENNLNDIVFLVMKMTNVDLLKQQVLYSNRACNSFGYETNNSPNFIDWEMFNESPYSAIVNELGYKGVCKYFQDRDTDEKYNERKTKRMAECLIKDYVSLNDIDAIVVRDNHSLYHVEGLARTYKFKGMVLSKPNCYY